MLPSLSIDWAHAATGGPRLDGPERAELDTAIASVPFWWHSIELAPGVVTPGQQSERYFADQWRLLELGDLNGRTVLDIGAWDGYHSFAAERDGAERVVALELPFHTQGLKVARAALGSHVEPLVADLFDVDPGQLGTFDVVLLLGVLYHLEDPLAGLRRVASLTRDIAVIETAAIVVPGYERAPLWRFYADDSLNNDPSNWWVPNEAAVHALCAAAGFASVETLASPRPRAAVAGELIGLSRLTCRARIA
jgi:tRNA (mo5U34)-methyltransferase